jgi:hypothetical protein
MIKIYLGFCCVCEHVQIFNYQFWDVFQLFSLVILVVGTMTLKDKEVPKQPSCMYSGFLGGLVLYHVRTTHLGCPAIRAKQHTCRIESSEEVSLLM